MGTAEKTEVAQERIVRPALIEVVLEVEGDVLVCDPCYFTEDGTEDPGELGFRFEGTGTWEVTTELDDHCGLHVQELCAVRKGASTWHSAEYVAHHECAVDAGIMGFIPVAAGRVPDWQEFCKELDEAGFHNKESRFGQPLLVQGRAVSSTAWGDGTYRCLARDGQDGRIAQIRVLFDEEVEEF